MWVVQWLSVVQRKAASLLLGQVSHWHTNQWIPITEISLALVWNCCTAVILVALSDPNLFTLYASYGGEAHWCFMVTCLGLMGYSPPGAQHALHHVGHMEMSDVWLHTHPHAMLLLHHVLHRMSWGFHGSIGSAMCCSWSGPKECQSTVCDQIWVGKL